MVVYGFGLVSYFFFDWFINELDEIEIVLMVVMIKGLLFYNLCKYFDCVIECCNLVFWLFMEVNEIML